MASVGSLRVDLGLNSAEFQAGMSKAERSMASFGKTAAGVGKAANDVGRMTAGVMQRQVNLAFQLQDIGVSLAGGQNPLLVAAQQGAQIVGIYGMGQGGLGAAFRDLAGMTVGLVAKMWPIAAVLGVVGGAIGAMTNEINKSKGATVSFGDVALASFQVIADGVYGVIKPAVEAIGGFFSNLWSTISPYIAMAANGIIGGFVGAVEAIKATWAQLPAALGDLAIQAAQGVINVFTDMGQKIVTGLNQTIFAINSKFGASLPTLGVPYQVVPGAVLDNPFAGAAAGVGSAAKDAFAGAQGDYLGDFMSAAGERARKNIADTKAEVDGLGGSAKVANDNLKGMANEGLSDLGNIGQQVSSTLSSGFADMFKGLITGSSNAMDAIGQLLGKLGDLFLNQGFNALFSGSGLGGLFGGIGKLFGFANGGSFQVGGSGGIDSQLVAFKASPNETVSITKPGQERMSGGAISVDVRLGVENGNIVPLVTQVAGQVAGQQIKQNNKQLPNLVADFQMRQG